MWSHAAKRTGHLRVKQRGVCGTCSVRESNSVSDRTASTALANFFWPPAPALSELAAATESLLPPVCSRRVERLLQPRPRCQSDILPAAE